MSAKYFGFNPAFYGGPNNILSRQEDEQLIKNDILQLLNTVPGERVNRPTFGTELRTSVFEPLDNQTIYGLRNSIIDAIETYEKRITLTEISMIPNEAQNQIAIKISGRFVSDPSRFITIDYLVNGRQ